MGLVCLLLCSTRMAWAAEYYVATTGSDSNPGSMAAPFASLQKGHDVAVAGDTVWVRGGTYRVVNGFDDGSAFTFSKSGQSDAKRIKYWAYAGEKPVFDLSQLKVSSGKKANGFYVKGSWLHFKGFEIANMPQPGTYTNSGLLTDGASNNVFEQLDLHHCGGPGLFIDGGLGGNLILNCDGHDNYDSKSKQGAGENADGFGVHYQKTGASTIIRGCRAWWNSDDGYDLINQEVPVIIENSWATGNGYIQSGTIKARNGNGFKAGSSKTGIRNVVRGCVAWNNPAAGFYANHSSGGNDWYNNTAYKNDKQYDLLASDPADSDIKIVLSGPLAHHMKNNIGFPDKNTNMEGVETSFNSWDLKLTPTADDFVSLSDEGTLGPRQADGSLPVLGFMKLRQGSQLIDKGTDIDAEFVGSAPDLGAYEYGAVSVAGSGIGGAAGNSGAGGLVSAGAGGQVLVESGGAGRGGVGGRYDSPAGSVSVASTAGVAGTSEAAGRPGASAGAGPIESEASCTCRAATTPDKAPSALLPILAAMSAMAGRRRAARTAKLST